MSGKERSRLRTLRDARVRELTIGTSKVIEGRREPSHHTARPGTWMPLCRVPRAS